MTESQTEAILNHHFEAFDRQDLTDLLSDYSEQSTLLYHQQRFQGLAEIGAFFDDFMHNQLPAESTFELQTMQIAGSVGYIVWRAETPSQIFEWATDTFVIENGKIKHQTFACVIRPKSLNKF
ncbi:MAG: nuclear transport factor 2 family protein [Thiomicrospira sp.]